MREILFRGKNAKGEWEYGVPLITGLNSEIAYITQANSYDRRVDIDTVGQYTGLTENGKKIFEGDIVNVNTKPNSLEHVYKSKHLVVRFDEYHRFVASGRLEYPLCNHYEWEVIGNIHDNPELLKGE